MVFFTQRKYYFKYSTNFCLFILFNDIYLDSASGKSAISH